ncbi:MAG: hypothetical protein R3F24_02490 [Gammaproteobacteria bacterium]
MSKRLDVLMISHGDADHRGGAESVLARYPSARLLGTNAGSRHAEPCRSGDQWWWDGVHFEVLHPPVDVRMEDDNSSSCVLRVTAGSTRVLLPGDIEAVTEYQLARRGEPGTADLVLAPHHGSRSSSTPDFVQATQARFTVFSTGFRNRWHFPATEVVARWAGSGTCLLDTAVEGSLQFDATVADGLRLTRRWRDAAPGIWLARPTRRCIVAPDQGK